MSLGGCVQVRYPDQHTQYVTPALTSWTRLGPLTHRLVTPVMLSHAVWSGKVVCVCVCVCMCVCVCSYNYFNVCLLVCVSGSVCVYECVHMRTCVCACVCICVFVSM